MAVTIGAIVMIAFPVAVVIVLCERRRALDDFNRMERDLPRHPRPTRRFR
ncbi:hypothetical protein [uncultured Sphingomonas sp.]|nr:hypothetical protein [uncultured Sphingomonas sp.]